MLQVVEHVTNWIGVRRRRAREAPLRALAVGNIGEDDVDRLAAFFDSEGIPLLVLKGPVLAQSVYGSVAVRPFVDLDLVIRRGDFSRTAELLREQSYTSRKMSDAQKAGYLYIHGQYTFWRRIASMDSTAVVLDVHTAIMPPGYSYRESFDALFERSGTMQMGGAVTHTLAREDLLLVLCYHGFKNRWDQLKYICDVAELIRSYPEMDWGVVFDRARTTRGRRVLLLGMALAEELLETLLPEDVSRDVKRDHRVSALSAAIIERLPRQAHMKAEPYLERVRLNVLGQDSALGGLRYGAYAALRRASELVLPGEDA